MSALFEGGHHLYSSRWCIVSETMTFEKFFERYPALVPIFVKLRDMVSEKFPDLRVRVQELRMRFYDVYPYCTIRVPWQCDVKVEKSDSMIISFELPVRWISKRFAAVTELSKDKFEHFIVVDKLEDIDGELIDLLEMAREWNNLYACRNYGPEK